MESRKKELRRRMRTSIDALDGSARERESRLVCDLLLELAPVRDAINVFSYLAFGKELSVDRLNAELIDRGAFVYVPVISTAGEFPSSLGGRLVFRRLDRDFASLPVNAYGIREPGPQAPAYEPGIGGFPAVPVITPGLAFDAGGGRLGRGGGYYDEFLRLNRRFIFAVGVCYSLQKVDSAPCGEDDEKIDCLVTPDGIFGEGCV